MLYYFKISYYVIYYIILYYFICIILHYVILYFSLLFYIILYYSIIYYIILYSIILYSIVLHYILFERNCMELKISLHWSDSDWIAKVWTPPFDNHSVIVVKFATYMMSFVIFDSAENFGVGVSRDRFVLVLVFLNLLHESWHSWRYVDLVELRLASHDAGGGWVCPVPSGHLAEFAAWGRCWRLLAGTWRCSAARADAIFSPKESHQIL